MNSDNTYTANLVALARTNRLLTMWLVVLSLVCVVLLGGVASMAYAGNEPPVHVFTSSGDTIGGDSGAVYTPLGIDIDSTTPVQLVRVKVVLDRNRRHTCQVTASATAVRTSGGGIWEYGLNVDATNDFVPASRRTIEFEEFADGGIGRWEVTTVMGFQNLKGEHTFYFLANKNVPATPTSRAFHPSMIVACFENRI